MSSLIIRLPDIGEGITEAEIVEWLVDVGDAIAEDQTIGSVMTDKAAVEIPSPVTGIVEALSGKVGEVLSVGAEYARIRTGSDNSAESDEAADTDAVDTDDTDKLDDTRKADTEKAESAGGTGSVAMAVNNDNASMDQKHSPDPAVDSAQPPIASAAETHKRPQKLASDGLRKGQNARRARVKVSAGKPTASPAVRRRAFRHEISLSDVHGTGPGGRVLHEDLDRFLARVDSDAFSDSGTSTTADSLISSGPDGDVEEIPVTGMRRAIARKMQLSKQRIPHFSYVEEVDVTELEVLRIQLNERSGERHPRLTLLPFIVLAMIRSLAEFPQMNARYDDEAEIIRRYRDMHLGIATQTAKGLMVPVLRRAQTMGIRSLAIAIARLADAARAGKLAVSDMGEGTLTVTSLGALGGLVSTPVINYPEVAIVGVNRIVTRPVFEGDKVVPHQLMNLSCSFDHRVVDGYDAAQFVQCIRGYLEFPASLFVPV